MRNPASIIGCLKFPGSQVSLAHSGDQPRINADLREIKNSNVIHVVSKSAYIRVCPRLILFGFSSVVSWRGKGTTTFAVFWIEISTRLPQLRKELLVERGAQISIPSEPPVPRLAPTIRSTILM